MLKTGEKSSRLTADDMCVRGDGQCARHCQHQQTSQS